MADKMAQRRIALDAVQKGSTAKQAAEKAGTTPSAVRHWAKAAGLAPAPDVSGRKPTSK